MAEAFSMTMPGPLQRGRALLLASAAAGALMLAAPGAALAQIVPPAAPCNDVSGTTVTCTGNLAAGVEIDPNSAGYTVLNVNPDLGPGFEIKPAFGVNGITFVSTGAVTVNSAADIEVSGYVSGVGAVSGILAQSNTSVTVDSTGTIESPGVPGFGGYGIVAEKLTTSSGGVSIKNNGNITATSVGIVGFAESGAVILETTGVITGSGLSAITANSTGTDSGSVVKVINDGNLHGFNGILVYGREGAVTVKSTGDITAAFQGVYATSRGAGSVNIDNNGAIEADFNGINIASASGDTTLTNRGKIKVTSGVGLYAVSQTGGIKIDTSGNITVGSTLPPGPSLYGRGISAKTANTDQYAIDIKNDGHIHAASTGIYAYANGSIVINSTGDIKAGDDASGIFAQSIGDPSGIEERDNDISIVSSGDITGGAGIFAYTLNAASANISVTHLSGTITGGENGNTAIHVHSIVPADGTVTATVTTSGALKGGSPSSPGGDGGPGVYFNFADYGSGAKMDGTLAVTSTGTVEGGVNEGSPAVAGTAIQTFGFGEGATLNVTVENSGTVTGSIVQNGALGADISFENLFGGLFNMGSMVYLGDGNELRNAGTLSPGGKDAVATVQVKGDLVQEAGGTMLIDVDGANNTADLINVTGSANLAGTATVKLVNPVSTSQKQYKIFSADGGVTANDLKPVGVPVDLSLLYPNPKDVVLGVSVDFTLDEDDLNRNQVALGQNLNAIIDAGTGGMSGVTNALLGITDLDQYRDALNQLLPEHYLNLQAASLFAAGDFAQSLMSCREREGAYAAIAEGQCIWAEADVSRIDEDGTFEKMRTAEDSYRFAAGGQFGLSEQWHIGVAFRYETLEQDTGDSAASDGQRFHAGAALKYSQGPLLLAGAVSAGRSWYDTERDFGFGGFSESASSSHEVDYLNGLLRAAYLLPMGDYYLKPNADLNVTHVSSNGFKEKGGGGAALEVDDEGGTYVSLSPALEAGAEWQLSSGTLIRPFISGGVTWFGDTGFTGTSSFIVAPEGADSFVTRTEIDKVMGKVTAGIDIIGVGDFDLRLRYEGAFGEAIANQALGLRASMRF
jgi:outer membrane autotransporter protein